jgi:hypothetical protein
MTDAERALWVQAKQDYTHALKIALETWDANAPSSTAEAIQAASATILIHVKHLRESSARTAAPSSAAPAAVKRDETRGPSQASGAVPPCPQCGGRTKRMEKRGEKSPDFQCLQDNGKCGKASKNGDKWFATGIWAKDLPKPNGARGASQPRPAEGYDQVPAGLAEDEGDSLPF